MSPTLGGILCVPALHSPLVSQGSGASWSEGCVWPVFAGSVCRLQDFSFFASRVCPLVGEAGLEACACPLVGGAGSCPSGGQGQV